MRIYSVHTVNDGKWQVVMHLREEDDFQHRFEPRPDLRNLIASNYELTPENMARLVMESVLHCDKVEVNMLSGPSLRIER